MKLVSLGLSLWLLVDSLGGLYPLARDAVGGMKPLPLLVGFLIDNDNRTCKCSIYMYVHVHTVHVYVHFIMV